MGWLMDVSFMISERHRYSIYISGFFLLLASFPISEANGGEVLFCDSSLEIGFDHGRPLDLSFSGYAESAEMTGVESESRFFQIVKGRSCRDTDGESVALPIVIEKPSGCSIGENAVRNEDVVFVIDGEERDAIVLSTRKKYRIALRFRAAGGYGQRVGAIRCKDSGAFSANF